MATTNFTLNTKEVIGDFKKYDTKTQKSLWDAVKISALSVKNFQKAILRAGVSANPTGKWTGNLAGSIGIKKRKRKMPAYEIGPSMKNRSGPYRDTKEYQYWIEEGKRSGNTGNFGGYHYVRDSVQKVSKQFNNLVAKALKP